MSSEEELLDRLRLAKVPPRMRHLRLADLTTWPPKALLCANDWAQSGGVLYLYGPNGTGKTTLAVAALCELLRRRPGGLFMDAQELGALAGNDYSSGEPMQAMRIASKRKPLVLDDLGQERHNAQVAEVIKRAVRTRLDAGVPLIITSNFRVSELGARPHYSTWLASRLADVSLVTQLQFSGPDHRLRPR